MCGTSIHYLIAWFVMHYSTLMSHIHSITDRTTLIVQHCERSSWKRHYKVMIRKHLQHHCNYILQIFFVFSKC